MTDSDPYKAPASRADGASASDSSIVQDELDKAVKGRKGLLSAAVIFAGLLCILRVNSSGAVRTMDMVIFGGGAVVLVAQAIQMSFKIARLQADIQQSISDTEPR